MSKTTKSSSPLRRAEAILTKEKLQFDVHRGSYRGFAQCRGNGHWPDAHGSRGRAWRPQHLPDSTEQPVVDTLLEATNGITLAAVAIGLITLLGAGIGLMNIMLVSVSERTREIGTRKAFGRLESGHPDPI